MHAVLRDPFSVSTGTSELKAALRPHLARALVAGSATWVLAFMVLGLILARLPADPDVLVIPEPPPFDLHEYVQVEPPPAGDVPPVVTMRQDAGTIRPVAEVIEPPVAFTPPGPMDIGAEHGSPTAPPSTGESPSGVIEREVLPEWNEIPIRDEDPRVISQVKPRYPEIAYSAGLEGRVTVQVLVDRTGSVVRARIVQSSPMFDASALEAARQWRFVPAMYQGRPIAVWIAVPVRFTLH